MGHFQDEQNIYYNNSVIVVTIEPVSNSDEITTSPNFTSITGQLLTSVDAMPALEPDDTPTSVWLCTLVGSSFPTELQFPFLPVQVWDVEELNNSVQYGPTDHNENISNHFLPFFYF